jgi:ribose transport system permease protein
MTTMSGDKTALPRRPFFSAEHLLRPETTLIAVILVIAIATTLRNPNFLNVGNLTDIARAAVIYFVMACGAALLMIGGGLDFSVGSVFTLGGISAGWLMQAGIPWPLAVIAGIVVGIIAGWLNSQVIARLHVPPIIATLGTFFIFTGLCVQITGGQDIVPLPDGFQYLGQGAVFGVPFIVIYAVIIGVVSWFLLEHTPFGVEVRAIGGNRKAALANGLKVARLETVLYVLAGGTGALAGIIYAARVGSAQVSAGGSGTTLSVVTAVLIGGVSLLGGLGSITGIAVGAILLSEIDNALIVAAVPPQYNTIVVGLILIAAVAIDHLRRERLYRVRR